MYGRDIGKRVNYIVNNSSFDANEKKELISRLEKQQRASLVTTAKQLFGLLALLISFVALYAITSPGKGY